MTSLSIVTPFFNEKANAKAFCVLAGQLAEELGAAFDADVRFVLVDDGSTDGGAEIFIAEMPVPATLLSLSRNFGKEIAVLAGLDAADSDLVLVMDADLQHTAAVASELVGAMFADPELDCAFAVRAGRKERDGWRRAGAASLFYRLINFRQRFLFPPDAGDFRVMRRSVASALVKLRDKKRFNKGLYAWAGFRTLGMPYEPAERPGGRSAWSRLDLLAYSIEAFTSFSALPLRIVSGIGFLIAIAGMLHGLKILLEVLFFGISQPGYPSLMVAILVLGGFNLALLGVLGEYVWAAVSEAKDRPVYLLRKTVDLPGKPAPEAGQAKKPALRA